MKTNKKALAILTAGLLAITPLAATGMTAFAATITVDKVTNDSLTHVYKAYPIITGTLATDGVTLTGLSWATGVNLSNLATALATFDTNNSSTYFSGFSSSSTPDEFATMLGTVPSALYENLAKVFNTSGVLSATGTTLIESGAAYTATGLADGWYVIKDETESLSDGVRSANILQIKGTTSITPKFSLPTLTKKIIDKVDADNDGELDRINANTASIGDDVNYELKTKVPDMTGYNKYFFVINDTLSSGLSFKEDSVVVKLDGTELVKNTDYEIQTGGNAVSGDETYTFQIVFKDFINKKNNAGEDIVVTYSATLDNDAVLTNAGNPNTANLVYSNDPNCNYTGGTTGNPDGPDEPSGNDVKGKTPDQTVKTFTTSIVIDKYELGTKTKKLSGVKFRLSGSGLQSVQNESGLYVKDANGTFYLLKNGTYTTDEPNGNDDAYASTSNKYAYTPKASITGTPVKVDTYGVTDENGALTFSGLNAGTYFITEVEAKDGYNLLSAPIKIDITSDLKQSEKTCTFNYAQNDVSQASSNIIEIGNAKGSTLPTTGGIGTKLFYIIGSLLVSGSVVLLVTKKRMGAKED